MTSVENREKSRKSVLSVAELAHMIDEPAGGSSLQDVVCDKMKPNRFPSVVQN